MISENNEDLQEVNPARTLLPYLSIPAQIFASLSLLALQCWAGWSNNNSRKEEERGEKESDAFDVTMVDAWYHSSMVVVCLMLTD